MSKTVAEYQSMLAKCDSRMKEEEEKLEKALAEEIAQNAVISNQETEMNSAKFAEQRNISNKTWLFCMISGAILAIASFVDAIYHLKKEENFIDAFFYNLESPVMITVGIIALIAGVVFLLLRKKKMGVLAKLVGEKTAGYDHAVKSLETLQNATENIKKEIENIKKEREYILSQMYADHPEELEKVNAAKKAERDAALRQLQEEEELNRKAAEEAKLKAERLIEGNKMFEHPQAYILDGQFENEFEVYMKAAEYGSVEAQEKVVSFLMGITFKNGVKQDIERGEALALSFAAAGNGAMYELLGKGYLYGEGSLPKEEEKGLKYLEKGATKGRQNAMLLAGICHYNGVGCEASEEEAKKYFAKAAKQGNAQAMQVLSAMENGQKLRF